MVVKNSLARRATEGTPLAAAFEGSKGTLAMVWGAQDIVSLAKEDHRLAGDKEFATFSARGGVMDGAKLTADEVEAGQQVAQPRGAVEPACGSDSLAGRQAGRAS